MRLYISWALRPSICEAASTELLIVPEASASALNHLQGLCIHTISLNEISVACLTPSSILLLSLTWHPAYTHTKRDMEFFLFLFVLVRIVDACVSNLVSSSCSARSWSWYFFNDSWKLTCNGKDTCCVWGLLCVLVELYYTHITFFVGIFIIMDKKNNGYSVI